jgi:chromate transporter
MGIMQAEIQERRGWVSRERFVEGLGLVNMLPGATAAQLAIYLGHARAGWWGGIAAGICFIAPAFLIMLALTLLYGHFGAWPGARRVFYGVNPVVLAIFAMAVYRLGRSTIRDWKQLVIASAAGGLVAATPIGIIPVLLVSGAVGVALYHAWRRGLVAVLIILTFTTLVRPGAEWLGVSSLSGIACPGGTAPNAPTLCEVGLFFLKVGAFTFGGGLSMLAFVQDQVVHQMGWLTAQQFLDGLALGQLTPGPLLMLAAFVGYQVASFWGAAVAAGAIFLPSFVLMFSVLPIVERMKHFTWVNAALKGVSPAVIGLITHVVLRMSPSALPDPLAGLLAGATLVLLLLWRVSPLPLMAGGATLGLVLRGR